MADTLRELVQHVDELIKNGKAEDARARLRDVQHRKIPRILALPVAGLARRANLPDIAIRILHPVVRPSNPSANAATEMEKAEYAASLTYIGASDEALGLLRGLDGEKHPPILLFHSFALFAQWNYSAAIPLLTTYLSSKDITDYQRLVGKVNLAAALIHERRHDEVAPVLEEIIDATKSGGFQLLHGNTLELAAQNAIYRRRWEQARDLLERAEQMLKPGQGLFALFVHKWKVIERLWREGPTKESLAGLNQIRTEARVRKHWETLRECDLFEALAKKDAGIAMRLFFGTPFPAYRTRVLQLFGDLPIPNHFRWELAAGKGAETLDLVGGGFGKGRTRLKTGQVLHRLLIILASDFYTPYRLPVLFGKLYQGEFFNPATSPPRVYRIVRRLREWFAKNGVPLDIPEEQSTYRLSGTQPVTLLTRPDIAPAEALDANLRQLKEQWPSEAFSAAQAGKLLNLSSRSALRLLQKAQEAGTLAKQGAAATTRYRFAS